MQTKVRIKHIGYQRQRVQVFPAISIQCESMSALKLGPQSANLTFFFSVEPGLVLGLRLPFLSEVVGLDCKSILTPSASQIYAFQRLKVYFLNIFVYVEAWTLEGSWLKHEKGKTYVRCRWHHMRKLKNNETPWDSVLSENLHLCLMGNFCQIEVWHPFNGKRARKVSSSATYLLAFQTIPSVFNFCKVCSD